MVGMQTTTGVRWRLGHRPGLDGLRGVAILLVIASHLTLNQGYSNGGPIGVTVFFVLSGFLITSLLLDERARTGRVSLRAFYLRRVRRLLPALAVFLAFVAATYVVVGRSLMGLLPVIFYASNWVRIGGHSLPSMNHTWSLAVEEQFYLVWPVALVLVLRWGRVRPLFWLALTGATGSVVARFLLWDSAGVHHARISYGSDTNAVGLLAGCALAAWMTMRPAGGRTRPGVAGVFIAGLVALGLSHSPVTYTLIGPLVAVGATCGALYLLCRDRGGSGVFGNPVLRFIGRRSYGYYLWQLPMHTIGAALLPHSILASRVLIVVLIVGVAELSWRLVERPFLDRGAGQSKGWMTAPSHQPLAVQSIG